MPTHKIIYSLIFSALLTVSLAIAADLKDFPKPFIRDGEFNGVLVIGDSAAAEDVIGITAIGMRLQHDMKSLRKLTLEGCGQYESFDVRRIDVGAVQLASRLKGREKQENIITIGGPCINSVTAALMGHPDNCRQGFAYGKAVIKLYEHDNKKVALVVAGYSAEDTLAAAKVLADYNDYGFQGKELTITDTLATVPTVKSIQ